MKNHARGGALAVGLIIALAGCETTQTQPEGEDAQAHKTETEAAPTTSAMSEESETVQAQEMETAAPQTTNEAPEPIGIDAIAGHWAGRWGGQAKSTLTVTGDTPETRIIEYCFKGECWEMDGYTWEDGTLEWITVTDSVFQFTLEGERLHGKLKRPNGQIYRVKMKRK